MVKFVGITFWLNHNMSGYTSTLTVTLCTCYLGCVLGIFLGGGGFRFLGQNLQTDTVLGGQWNREEIQKMNSENLHLLFLHLLFLTWTKNKSTRCREKCQTKRTENHSFLWMCVCMCVCVWRPLAQSDIWGGVQVWGLSCFSAGRDGASKEGGSKSSSMPVSAEVAQR